ncbi:MAG: hypothetical protein H6704_10740 [Myxococcales bacterium]|nr:hypothetical protein [Myxococcales bacterium]
MGITFDIDLETLRQPSVAAAVADLMQALSVALGGATAPAPAARVVEAAPAAPARPAPPKAKAPKPAAPAPAPAPRAASSGPDPAEIKPMSFEDFVAALPLRSQRFLNLVQREETVTRSRAIDALELSSGKQLGGVTGAIAKWAPRRGLEIPYETITLNGERAWRWTGPKDASQAAPASAPAPIRRRPARDVAPPEDRVLRAADIDSFLDALPEQAARFMRALRKQGSMDTQQALELFGFERSRQLGAVLEPIKRIGRDLGIERPFEDERTPEGKRYRWPA